MRDCGMKRWVALLLMLSLSLGAFADKKKKDAVPQELDEVRNEEFDYAFMEGVRNKIIGNFNEALSWFGNCLKILPKSPVAQYEIADLLTMAEKYTEALEFARGAVAGNPDNIWYKVLLANVLQKKAMIEDACNVYAEIIEEYPDREEFYLIEAALYASIEKWQKAIEVYDKYEAHFGVTEPASIEKIRLYTRLENSKKASAELLKLIRKFPERSEYLSLLAELYFNYDQDKKGLQILNRLLKAEPDNGFVHFYLADYYRDKKQFEEADKHTQAALVSDKLDNNFKIQYLLRLILNADTTLVTEEQLDAYMAILMEKYSDDLAVRALHSDFLRKDNKLQEAKKELEYILSRDKNNYLIWEELLLLCNDLQDTADMYARSLEAIQYFPEQPLPYALAGMKLMMDGDFEGALPFLEEGLELSGDNQPMRSQFYSFLGDCYYTLDRAETAFLMYEEVLKINPNDALVLNNYAYYLALRKENLSKAEQMSAQAVKLDPNNATALDTYAWVLYVRGNYSQARFYMKLCLEKVTEPSGVYFDHYGDILYKYGSKAEAWDMWKKALELGLDDEEALEILKQKVETGILPE